MWLGEPSRTQFDLNFAIFGIPVRIDPWFWAITLMLGGYRLTDAGTVVTWVIAVFIAILVHELGHALVMRAYGFQPWITLYGMGGLTSARPGYYGVSGPGTSAQVLISLAGPCAGFLLATVIVAVCIAAHIGQKVVLTWFGPVVFGLQNPRIGNLINNILFICTWWGMVNLLPVYPLDGGQVVRELLVKVSPRNGISLSLSLSFVAAGIVAVLAIMVLKSIFIAMMFGYLAYASYATLQAYRLQRP